MVYYTFEEVESTVAWEMNAKTSARAYLSSGMSELLTFELITTTARCELKTSSDHNVRESR